MVWLWKIGTFQHTFKKKNTSAAKLLISDKHDILMLYNRYGFRGPTQARNVFPCLFFMI